MSDLNIENKELTKENKDNKKALWNNTKEIAMLQSEMYKYKKFYDSVPEDIRKGLKTKRTDISR